MGWGIGSSSKGLVFAPILDPAYQSSTDLGLPILERMFIFKKTVLEGCLELWGLPQHEPLHIMSVLAIEHVSGGVGRRWMP